MGSYVDLKRFYFVVSGSYRWLIRSSNKVWVVFRSKSGSTTEAKKTKRIETKKAVKNYFG